MIQSKAINLKSAAYGDVCKRSTKSSYPSLINEFEEFEKELLVAICEDIEEVSEQE